MLESALKYCKEKAIDLLAGFVPKTYSMTEECNILGLYDDTFIITKQENLVGIISLQGLSYSNLMQKDLEGYFDTRQNVLNTISKDIQLRIVAKRRKEFINQSPNIDNIYAKAIITQFESKEIYKTEYFLVFETITSNVKSFFEKKKLEMTTSINEELEESSKENKRIVEKMTFAEQLRHVKAVGDGIFVDEEDHWVSKAKELFVFFALLQVVTKGHSSFYDVSIAPANDYAPLIHPKSPYYKQLYQHDKKTGEIILDPQTNEPILIPNVNARKLWYLQVSEQKYADPKDPRNFDPNEPEPTPRSEESLDEIVRNDARAWANSAEEEFASIISTFNRFVSVFKSNQVRIATSKMSFDYEELRTDNISLYIVIAQKDINTLAPLVRVILESIAKNLLTNESSKKEERIYMILDEFVRFGKLPFLLEMPALCRSYNVVPLFITQDYAMIRKYYSDDDLKILKGVVHYNIVFKMNSAEDAEIVSKEVGEFTRQSKNYSTEKGQLVFGGSSSYSHESRNLLTAQDIMNINSDEVIVIVTGAKATPLKLKANYWFKDKELLKRANLPIDLEVERQRVEEPIQPTTEIETTPNQNKADLEPSNKGEKVENESNGRNTNENNPTTPQELENSNLKESEKDNESPITLENANENIEQGNHNEIDEILKKPLSEISMEEKRALFKKMQQGDEESEQEVTQSTQS